MERKTRPLLIKRATFGLEKANPNFSFDLVSLPWKRQKERERKRIKQSKMYFIFSSWMINEQSHFLIAIHP